jgi:hypothetical protein
MAHRMTDPSRFGRRWRGCIKAGCCCDILSLDETEAALRGENAMHHFVSVSP